MSGIIAQNTLLSSGLIKSPAAGGAWNFISKQTASSDSTIDFTSGIDSTYKLYLFTFNNIHPETDGVDFEFQDLNIGMGNDNDQCLSGTLHLFAPSDTTFVKHFIARIQSPKDNDYHVDMFIAGYFNTTTALTRLRFQMSSDAIDAGDICLYGLTT